MSKAQIHSDLPKLFSERPFALKLLALDFPDNNQPHLWFVKLPGLKDIDAIIWLPRTGLFILEMKSWPLSGIRHISVQRFEVAPSIKHSTKKSPWEQVQEAEQQFKTRLVNDPDTNSELRHPWTSPVVALYRISRSEFESRFKGERGSRAEANFKQLIARGTVFEEDLESGDIFVDRLQYCRYNPIFGNGPNSGPFGVKAAEAVKVLDAFISPHLLATRAPSAYDKERLRELETASARRLKTISWGQPILCTGYAGTGKTLLGLHAALLQLEPKPELPEKVDAGLFICFNKVLASDIDRLTALSPRFRQFKFDVFDIFELLKFLASRCQIPIPSEGGIAKKWAKELLSSILAREDTDTQRLLDSWNLIIVDEAQDLEDWSWDLLDRLSSSGNNLFVIDGKNQLLYRDKRAPYLDLIYEAAKETEDENNFIEQRRVFRTTDTTFLISQLFMEAYPNLEQAQTVWETRLKPRYEQAKKKLSEREKAKQPSLLDIELPRRGGYAHRLIPLKPTTQEDIISVVTEYLRDGYEKTKEYYREDEPSNVLILVPFKDTPSQNVVGRYNWPEIARTACRNLHLRYIDYSDEKQRRRAYAGDEVRICTFHSSRGIEGLHSIILGFDSLAEAVFDDDWRTENLGYITLSRSVYDTDVLYIEDDLFERREIEFLKGIIEIVGR